MYTAYVKKSYEQYCGLAKALDVIGDRWILLIVRELMIGEARYSDLLKGLPGIATNLLATRLEHLEAAGVVMREVLLPPVTATVYRLTPRGEALRPVIFALGKWAAPLMTAPRPGEAIRARWIALPIEMYLEDATPKASPIAIQVDGGDESIVIETRDGKVRARTGTVPDPDVVLSGSPALALSVLMGKTSVAAARAKGMKVQGRIKALTRLRPAA